MTDDRLPDGASLESLIARVADDFAERARHGERPDVEEYVGRWPHLAEVIREVLTALPFLRPPAGDLTEDVTPAAAVPPAPGCLGDFRILREVGRGGMGVVYEAEQLSLKRRVALKVLSLAGLLDARQLHRFRNEAQAAACLHHPHIVPVYFVGSDRGVHYYAMQFIDGRTVADLIEALRGGAGAAPGHTPPAPVAAPAAETCPAFPDRLATERSGRPGDYCRTAARLGMQAAEALDYAHQMGVVHRDVKPANLLVDGGGDVWVTDFGLARCQTDPGLTATGDLLGTVRYMSPEQALGRRGVVDHRSDVYSLGVTLYELLALRPAFLGEDRQELLLRIAREEPVALRRLNRAVLVELETIVAKAMAKHPGERYATALELAEDLRRFLDDLPIRARRPTPAQRLRRWARQHRALATSAALSAGIVLVGLLLAALGIAYHANRVAEGKAQAEMQWREELYPVLLEHAENLRLERQPGYRARVWADLRRAVALELPERGPDLICPQVVSCLGDPIGLDPEPDPAALTPAAGAPKKVPAKVLAAATELPVRMLHMTVAPGGRLVAGWCPFNDGGFVFLYSDDGVRRAWARLLLGAVYDLKFAAEGPHPSDGLLLVAGCEQGLQWWAVPGLDLRGMARTGNVPLLATQPRGRMLATAGREGKQAELWSLASGQRLASLPLPGGTTDVAFSADGDYLLALRSGTAVRAWPVRRTPEKQMLSGHAVGAPAVAFGPDGRLLASGAKDSTVRLWDAGTGKLLHTCTGHEAVIEAVCFSPDGTLVASGDWAGVVRLWHAESGEEAARAGGPQQAPGQVWRLAFSPAGDYLAAAGSSGVAVWAVRRAGGAVTLDLVRTVGPPRGATGVTDLAYHPGGRELVFLDEDMRLFRYDIAEDSRSPLDVRCRRGALRALSFDPAGERLTFVGRDGNLGILDWRTATARVLPQAVFHPAFGPTGRWVAAANPAHGVVIYDTKAGRELFSLPAEESEVWGLAWAPDGRRLAVSLSDGALAVWDLDQVCARLAEFGIEIPPFACSAPAGPEARLSP
jgi:serine/threonine protein kinase/WD40 repeat protein